MHDRVDLLLTKKTLDERTDMLCRVLGAIEGFQVPELKGDEQFVPFRLPKDITAWWKEHKKLDEERQKK